MLIYRSWGQYFALALVNLQITVISKLVNKIQIQITNFHIIQLTIEYLIILSI